MSSEANRFTIVAALSKARDVARQHGIGDADVVAVQFWGRFTYEHKYRVAFVRPSRSADHSLEYWILLVDLDSQETAIEHGYDLPFPRSPSAPDNYRPPWPDKFIIDIDRAIQIAMGARSRTGFGPRQLGNIFAVCFEQRFHQDETIRSHWHVVVSEESPEGDDIGHAFFIDPMTGDIFLPPLDQRTIL